MVYWLADTSIPFFIDNHYVPLMAG